MWARRSFSPSSAGRAVVASQYRYRYLTCDAKQTGPSKKSYRLFNIPKKLSANDVGSLRHVIERRLKYYDDPKTKPDLLLIDGGKTQLKFVNAVLDKAARLLRTSEMIVS